MLFSTVLVSVTMLLACCGGDPGSPDDATGDVPTFDGVLTCPDGGDVGGVGWDYGADPKGFVDDPAAWVRDNGRGLDEGLTLTLLATAGDREDVVIATRDDGAVLLFVDFGQDAAGAFFPVEGEACPSSGLEDFNQGS